MTKALVSRGVLQPNSEHDALQNLPHWQVATDYLLEHWHPNLERKTCRVYYTDFTTDFDRWLIENTALPHYGFVGGLGSVAPPMTAPLFTKRMGALLQEIGIRVWYLPGELTTRHGPGGNVSYDQNYRVSRVALHHFA